MNKYFSNGDLTNEADLILEHNKKKFTQNYHQNKLAVRDRVRIRMSSLFSNLRQVEKAGYAKNVVVRYTPAVFIIVKVIPPKRDSLGYPLYSVIGPNRKLLRNNGGGAKLFNATELLKINPDSVSHISMQQAAKLNDVPFQDTTEQDEPVVDKEPLPPKPDEPEFKSSAEWKRALLGKTFTDSNKVHGEVVDIDNKKGIGYRVFYGDWTKKRPNGKYLIKDQFVLTLSDFLQDAQSEPWYVPSYDGAIE